MVACPCDKCDGAIVALYIRRDHERRARNDYEDEEDEEDAAPKLSALEIIMLKKKAKAAKKERQKAARLVAEAAAPTVPTVRTTETPEDFDLSAPREAEVEYPIVPDVDIPPQDDILATSSAGLSFHPGDSLLPTPEDPRHPGNSADSCLPPQEPTPTLPFPVPSSPVRALASHIASAVTSVFTSTPSTDEGQLEDEVRALEGLSIEPDDAFEDDTPSAQPPAPHLGFTDTVQPSAGPTRLPPPSHSQVPQDPPPSARNALLRATDVWFWRPLMLLFAWAHLHYHVSHRAMHVFISFFRYVLIALGHLDDKSDIPRTLKTTFNRLGLTDKFFIAPMCPACFRVYPPDSLPTSACSHCNIPLFKGSRVALSEAQDTSSFAWHLGSSQVRTFKPVLQTPMRLPSTMLADLIHRTPQMERDLDSWRSLPPDPTRLRCVQDGAIWQSLLGPDGRPFFDNSAERSCPEELRLGVTLGFDG